MKQAFGIRHIQSIAEIVDESLSVGKRFIVARNVYPFFLQALKFNDIVEFKVESDIKEETVQISVLVSEKEANRIQECFEAIIFEG